MMNHPIKWARMLCACLSLLTAVIAMSAKLAAQTLPPKLVKASIDDFYQQPSSHQVTLSPDGKKIAWIYAIDGKSVRQLKVLDIETNKIDSILASPFITAPIWHSSSESLYVLTESSLLFMPINKQDKRKTILKFDPTLKQRFFKYDTANERIYFSEEDEKSHRIFTLNEQNQKQVLLSSKQRIKNFYHFPNHNALFYTLAFNDHVEIMALENGELRSLRSCDMITRCSLLGVNIEQRYLFIDSNAQSRLDAISRLTIDSNDEVILMVDPEEISDRETSYIHRGQHVFTSFFGDYRRFYSPNKSLQSSLDYLTNQFPEKNLSLQLNNDLSQWLVQVSAGNMQLPDYYIFKSRNEHLTKITNKIELNSVKISSTHLAKPSPMTYKARDGLDIQSYVWLPKDVDLTTAPVVAFIHGGPWTRLKGEYDVITQILVSNGYIVFQPNFRASWGFGVDFITAGAKTFGKGPTHNDIIDGIETLLSKGIGDRQKLAIFGHSFGGFSVLGALAFEPDYFKAGFASAPPAQMISFNSDKELKKSGRERALRGFDRLHQDRVFLFDERNQAEVEHMYSVSPEAHKMAIKAPLIIAAGARDRKVPVAGVKRYALALKNAGKPISLFIDNDATHSFNWDPTWSSLIYLMERFFKQHLGGTPVESNDSHYQQHLKKMEAFSSDNVSTLYNNLSKEHSGS
ncbi:alpha/beta hydrolase family protein [Thalassotalea ganghwensis]